MTRRVAELDKEVESRSKRLMFLVKPASQTCAALDLDAVNTVDHLIEKQRSVRGPRRIILVTLITVWFNPRESMALFCDESVSAATFVLEFANS